MSENPWPNGVPERMPAEDRAEIEELFARYAWGIDLADEEQAIATFAEDAEFDHLWQGKVSGHAAIRENLRKLWYDRQHWWYGRQHTMNHFIMDPLPQGARVRCFFQILQWNADYNNNFVFGIGTRDDRLVRRAWAVDGVSSGSCRRRTVLVCVQRRAIRPSFLCRLRAVLHR